MNPKELTEQSSPRNDPRLDHLNREFLKICADVFKVRDIDPNANFFEMGGDSIKAFQVAEKFEKIAGGKLPLSHFVRYPIGKIGASNTTEVERSNILSRWWKTALGKPRN